MFNCPIFRRSAVHKCLCASDRRKIGQFPEPLWEDDTGKKSRFADFFFEGTFWVRNLSSFLSVVFF